MRLGLPAPHPTCLDTFCLQDPAVTPDGGFTRSWVVRRNRTTSRDAAGPDRAQCPLGLLRLEEFVGLMCRRTLRTGEVPDPTLAAYSAAVRLQARSAAHSEPWASPASSSTAGFPRAPVVRATESHSR
jgi:hypothetical protein